MRARLTYLALRPTAPRRAAQTLTEAAVLLLAIIVLVAVFQLPALATSALVAVAA